MRRLLVLSVVSVLALGMMGLADYQPAQASAQAATCAAATPEQNEAVVRDYFEKVYNQKRLDLVDPMMTDDVVRHNMAHPTEHPTGTAAPHNADDAALIRETVMTTFPDFHITVDDMRASGDMVAAMTTATGTQKGAYRVSGGVMVPASGRAMQYTGISFYRIRCNQIAEIWALSDNLTLLRQIGSLSNGEIASISAPEVGTPAAGAATPAGTPGAATPVGTPMMSSTPMAGTPAASCQATSPAQNEALASGYLEEVYNNKELDKVGQYLAYDFAHHTGVEARPYAQVPGTADDEAAVRNTVMTVFPDFHTTVDSMVASGDRVAVMVTSTGTQMGPISVAGGVTVPATGRKVQYSAMVVYRMQCGHLAEAWNVTDNLTLLRQVGAIANSEMASLAPPEVATPAS